MQLTPFRNPTTNYRIRIFKLTFLFLSSGEITEMIEIWGGAGDPFTK